MIVNDSDRYEMIVKEVLKQIRNESFEDWVTPEFIAKDLKVSPASVRRWCQIGALGGKKFDSQWRIRRSVYQKFLEER